MGRKLMQALLKPRTAPRNKTRKEESAPLLGAFGGPLPLLLGLHLQDLGRLPALSDDVRFEGAQKAR